MISQKKLVLFFLFSTILLALRDTPFLNVLIIEKVWILYFLMLFWILSHFIPKRGDIFFFAAFLLLLIALIFTLSQIVIVPEAIGIAIYALLWLILVQNIISLINNKAEKK